MSRVKEGAARTAPTCGPLYGPGPQCELTREEIARGQQQWALMTPDMRDFVTRLVENGGINGRQMLANCSVTTKGPQQ